MNTKLLNGQAFKTLVTNGYLSLSKDIERINSLNVFPVPDGDTGTNMKLTIEGGVKAISNDEDDSIGDVSKKIAKAMTMSARGNSGVILSQFFKGLSNGLIGKDSVDAKELIYAFECGVKQSYQVVQKPTEGTILTVMREATQKVKDSCDECEYIEDFFKIFIKEAKESLNRTPDLLPILKQAGVIDSGGAGYNCIIEGMVDALDGNILKNVQINNTKSNASVNTFNADSVLEFGYCTEFILQLLNSKVDIANFDIQEIISFLETVGNSIVAFKDDDIVKVHVHTFTPGKVIDYCQKFGEYVTFKMENMSVQHSSIEVNEKKEHKKFATVAVSLSENIANTFKELGCDEVILGGQTMNPSSEDFIKAFKKIDAENIFVFPNNKNIYLAAMQAKENYENANVIVLKTTSIAQCLSALSMMDFSSDDLEKILLVFNESINNVLSISITYAIRDCNVNGLNIHQNDYMAIVNGKIVSSNKDKVELLKTIFNEIDEVNEKEVMTIIYGNDINDEEKSKFLEFISSTFDYEINEIDGNQDIYSVIIALE